MNKIDQVVASIDIAKYWKVFVFSMLAVFLMVILPHFINKIIQPQQVISPAPAPDVMKNVQDKLLTKPKNYFHLQKKSSFLKTAYADTQNDYQDLKAYVTVDLDSGEILEQKALSDKLPIASLTKIMTAVVALDLAKPQDLFEVSTAAANQIPTKIGMLFGEKMSLEELLNGALLTSANDAVDVIKEGINKKYGGDVFVKAMNEKAKLLGLKNSHFTNPQGFDIADNYSSVEDLAILSHYALSNYPLIAEIVKKDYQFQPANEYHGQHDLYNWNGLIGVYPGASGIKIGNTNDAGYTTAVLSKRSDKKVLVVLLGAPGVLERDLWASELLDAGFEKDANLEPVNLTKADLKQKYSTWKYWN